MAQSPTAGTSQSSAIGFLQAVLGLDLALERCARYPESHPLVAGARDAYVRAWKCALAEVGPLRLWIAAGRLGWGVSEVHALPGPRIEPLSRLLHSMQLTAIEADRDAGDEDLLALLDLIRALRFDLRPLDTIRRWQRQPGRRVRVAVLDVDSFRYGERRPDQPSGEIWAGLHRYLAGDGSDAAAVARALGEMLDDQELLGLGAVRADILEHLERAGPEHEREATDRIRRLLAAFPESIRADLLRIETSSTSSLLARLVRPLPARDALSALLQLGHVDGKLPRGTTTIFTQILHCLPDGLTVSQSVLGTSAAPVDVGQVACALESLFATRTEQDFNPEDYQRRLTELARQENLCASASTHRVEQLSDPSELVAQVGGIAAMSYAEARTEEQEPLLDRLERAVPDLLGRARLDLVAVGARSIRARRREGIGPSGMLVTRLTDHLDTMLRLGPVLESSRDDLRAVLALLPPDVVARATLRHLLAATPGFEPRLLQSVLLDHDGSLLAGLLEDTVADSPASIDRVRPLLRSAQSSEVRGLLQRLVAHADRRVRRTALVIVVEQDGVAGHLAELERAVSDPDAEIARWALQSLASSPAGAADVTETLGRILDAHGTRLSEVVCSRILLLLLQRGSAGVHRAAAVVDRCRRSPTLRSARLARRIVARVAPFRTDPAVRSILHRWNWSVARLISLLPAREGGEAHA